MTSIIPSRSTAHRVRPGRRWGWLAILCCLPLAAAPPSAAGGDAAERAQHEPLRRPLEALTVVALAPLDERAVVRLPGGELLVVEVDDPLPQTAAVVAEVLADRLVVEEEVEADPPRRRRVWIFKPEKLGARSRVVVLDPTPPPLPPVPKPRIITLDSGDPATEENPRPKTDAQ